MKTLIIVTILLVSGMIFLTSCRTVDGSRPDRGRAAAETRKKSAMASPYYGSDAEGSYYYKTEADSNADYQPQVRRNFSGMKAN